MEDQQREALRRKIKYYMLDHNVMQKDIASAVGASEKFFSKVVNGEKTLTLNQMIALARFMGTTVDDLIRL